MSIKFDEIILKLVNNEITELNLDGYFFGCFFMLIKDSEENVVKLSDALKVTNSLTSLTIRYNQINDADVEIIAEALKVTGPLISLDVSGNTEIGTVGSLVLLDAWKLNINIKKIIGINFKEVTDFNKLNEEFTTLTNNAQKYHLCRIGYIIDNSKLSSQMKEFMQQYESKTPPKLLTILSSQDIYNDKSLMITEQQTDINIFSLIGTLLNQETRISFKMTIDDACAFVTPIQDKPGSELIGEEA